MFEVHKLNEQGMELAANLQSGFKAFLAYLEDVVGPIGEGGRGAGGRELAIVRTKLEEASFYAKRAMAMQPDNHTEVIG